MDDIRPPRNATGLPSNTYGRVSGSSQQPLRPQVAPAQANYSEEQQPLDQTHAADNTYSLPVAKKPGKKLKVLLIVFVVLTIALGGFVAWQYTQVKDLQSEVDELTKENQRLNERVYSLNYDNRDLNQKVELLTTENESLQELNKSLLETCGSACSTVIP